MALLGKFRTGKILVTKCTTRDLRFKKKATTILNLVAAGSSHRETQGSASVAFSRLVEGKKVESVL